MDSFQVELVVAMAMLERLWDVEKIVPRVLTVLSAQVFWWKREAVLLCQQQYIIMDWIDNCENLVGLDEDDEECPLLTEWHEDRSARGLMGRRNLYLKRNEPNVAEIHHVKSVIIKTLSSHCEAIVSTFSDNEVTPEMQHALHSRTELMRDKVFFLTSIHRTMLDSITWIELQGEIYVSVNECLLEIIKLCLKYPQKPKESFIYANIYFLIHDFLAQSSMSLWDKLVPENSMPEFSMYDQGSRSNRTRKPKNEINLALIIPTMRRLGMLDCLDIDWNMVGDWNDILQHLAPHGAKPVKRSKADEILVQRSNIWRKSRNSMFCRRLARGSNAPQCHQYFPKCSVTGCANIETPEKPHKIRCTRCWYFHFCCKSCESFADMHGLHRCSNEDMAKAAGIRSETELYLKKIEDTASLAADICEFCSVNKNDLPEAKMMRCGRCGSVAYCSKQCQQWDWTLGEHKMKCNHAS